MKHIKVGWQLTKKSWHVLRSEKSLILFPAISMLSSLLVWLAMLAPVIGLITIFGSGLVDNDIVFYLGFFLFLLAATVVTVFFNVALVSQVREFFADRQPTISGGIAQAWARKKEIISWSLLAATVGTILRVIADRLPFAGALLSAVGGLAWGVASWFVIPIIAMEGLGPTAALKRSVDTVKQRWGEGVTGVIAIGAVVLLAAIVLMVATVAGIVFLVGVNSYLVAAWGLLCFLAFIILILISTALRQIFDLAVYLSISSEQPTAIGPFTAEEISLAAVSKNS